MTLLNTRRHDKLKFAYAQCRALTINLNAVSVVVMGYW